MTLRTLLLAAALVLASCGDKPATFNSMDVTGATWAQHYELPNLQGQPVSERSFPGRVTAVFFGFLYCPDACPTHLTKMVELKKRLGKDADRLQVVFITVDPESDQPEALAAFLSSFDPSFVGLRGTPDQVAATAKDFRVFFKKNGPSSIDHTTFTYVYDPQGRLRLVVPQDLAIEKLESDVRVLLK